MFFSVVIICSRNTLYNAANCQVLPHIFQDLLFKPCVAAASCLLNTVVQVAKWDSRPSFLKTFLLRDKFLVSRKHLQNKSNRPESKRASENSKSRAERRRESRGRAGVSTEQIFGLIDHDHVHRLMNVVTEIVWHWTLPYNPVIYNPRCKSGSVITNLFIL